MEEDEVEDDIDVSAGASGLGGGEFSTRSRFGENLGAIPVGGGRICKFGLEIQI